MAAQIHVALHANEQRPIRCRRAVPCARASARDLDRGQSALDADLPRDRFRERAATGVTGAYEQNLHAIMRLRSGWARSRATARLRLPQDGSHAADGRCNRQPSTVAIRSVVRRRALAVGRARSRRSIAREFLLPTWRGEPPAGWRSLT